jgi:hypothetical protein
MRNVQFALFAPVLVLAGNCLAATEPPLFPVQRLNQANPAQEDSASFGTVAVDGDNIIVGASMATSPYGGPDGVAYAFRRQANGIWRQVQQLDYPEPSSFGGFGSNVEVKGPTAVVSASRHSTADGLYMGRVYIYRLAELSLPGSGPWFLEQTLVAPDERAGGFFGNSTALKGNTLVIGAFGAGLATEIGWRDGAVYVYTRASETAAWQFLQKIVAPEGTAVHETGEDRFGWSVALDPGGRLVIGARTFLRNGKHTGAAFIYEPSVTTGLWEYRETLAVEESDEHWQVGNTVAIHGDTVAVTAVEPEPEVGWFHGQVHLFARDPASGAWVRRQTLRSPTDTFGYARARGLHFLREGLLAVGDYLALPFRSSLTVTDGAVLLYERDAGGVWRLQSTITAPYPSVVTAPDGYDGFGGDIAADSDTLVTSAGGARILGARAGAVWAFQTDALPVNLGLQCQPVTTVKGEPFRLVCEARDLGSPRIATHPMLSMSLPPGITPDTLGSDCAYVTSGVVTARLVVCEKEELASGVVWSPEIRLKATGEKNYYLGVGLVQDQVDSDSTDNGSFVKITVEAPPDGGGFPLRALMGLALAAWVRKVWGRGLKR